MENQPIEPAKTDKKQHFHPSRMARVVILALEEILGQGGITAASELANLSADAHDNSPRNQGQKFPITQLIHLQAGLESAYGFRAGRGLALRLGRASFKYGLREFGADLGLTDLAFRLLPLQKKIKTGCETLADLFNTHTDQRVRLEGDEKYISWHIQRCPLCLERQVEGQCCHFAVGLLQEALYWVSGGRYFEVKEMKCIACGDNECTILINQTPIG
jgi:predicted hydrocarbon binding protein